MILSPVADQLQLFDDIRAPRQGLPMDKALAATVDDDPIARIVATHAGIPGALLPILHDVQSAMGFIPAEAIAMIAEALNLSRAEVHGTVSFYRDFRLSPAARPILRLCRAEACQARGAEALAPLAEADGRVSVEAVYCLGLCASGPAAMVGERVFGRLDGVALRRMLDEVAG